MNKDDVLIESASPKLLAKLRMLDNEIGQLTRRSQEMVEGYVSGKGWDNDTHDIALDLNTGLFTLTPKAPGPNAASVGEQQNSLDANQAGAQGADANNDAALAAANAAAIPAGEQAAGAVTGQPEPAVPAPAVNT